MKVGALTIDAARDGQFLAPLEMEYPDMEPARWDRWRDLLQDGDKVVNEFGSFVIRGEDRVVLVDLGFGPAEVPDWQSGELLRSLDALGVQPGDVTDVMLTHLHFDHIGWATVGGEITFPNATYRCDERDWPHFTIDYTPNPEELTFPAEMLPENKLAPLADRIAFFSAGDEPIPGIQVIDVPGHSPGHVAFRVSSQGEEVILAGDIAHHQAELLEPDWQGVSDVDPDRARESRHWLAGQLADTGTTFCAAHFRDWQWGRITRTDAGLEWEPVALVAGR